MDNLIKEHAYSFQLNWEKMQPLVRDMNIVWKELKDKLEIIIT